MENVLVFDIETIANARVGDYLEKKKYRPPSNYKDPEKIAAWMEEKREDDRKKAALHWWTGKVIVIVAHDLDRNETNKFYGDSEWAVLADFFDLLHGYRGDVQLVGKNTYDFDVPFLVGRALYHDLGLPAALRDNAFPGDINHCLTRSRSSGQLSTLDDYAFGLGIPMKPFGGAEVGNLHAMGAMSEIVDYCTNDVQITAEFLRRWNKKYVPQQMLVGGL